MILLFVYLIKITIVLYLCLKHTQLSEDSLGVVIIGVHIYYLDE